MITNLYVRNYRSFGEIDVNLGRLTVLVGPNGAGKSNFIDALRFVRDALQRGLDAAVVNRGGMSALRRWSAKGRPYDVELRLRFKMPSVAGHYRFALGSSRRSEYRVKEEQCLVTTANYGPQEFEIRNGEWISVPSGVAGKPASTTLPLFSDGSTQDMPSIKRPLIQPTALMLPLLTGLPAFGKLYDFLTGSSFYTIMPNILQEPQKPANPYPLEEDATNLASVLRDLKRKHQPAAQKLECALFSILGDVEQYQVNQVGSYLVTKLKHTVTQEDRSPLFELFQESDGTLRVLGILTALYQEPSRPLIALEEPELTIHPGAAGLLWEEIQAASERCQILITTHSPDLLDMCSAEQVRVVEKIDGITHIGAIDAEQRQIIAKRLFAPGQLLRAQGLYRATKD
ncbi:MAG: AAA family ATPase [Anaerolineae bacterium]|nr:AAA family ATPase [Anaerolineae bacterium]